MINYVEKGIRMHTALSAANLPIRERDGVWVSNASHSEINAFISNYNELIEAKKEKKAEILKGSNDFLELVILSKYPRFEIDTWQNQKADSEAYIADNNAVTVTLDALSSQRGKSKSSTANKILEKAGQFAAFSAMYAGERQRLEDLVDAALTVEEVQAVKFKAL